MSILEISIQISQTTNEIGSEEFAQRHPQSIYMISNMTPTKFRSLRYKIVGLFHKQADKIGNYNFYDRIQPPNFIHGALQNKQLLRIRSFIRKLCQERSKAQLLFLEWRAGSAQKYSVEFLGKSIIEFEK